MAQAALPLTALSEAQRTQALERLVIIRPALEKHVSQTQVTRTHQISPCTIQLCVKRYREMGLAGLTPTTRSDKSMSLTTNQHKKIVEKGNPHDPIICLPTVWER